VRVPAGGRFRVVDVQGGQIGDLFAFNVEDLSEYASAEHTRAAHWQLFPRVGQHFVTNRRRPILLMEQDTSPGVHDMLIAACDPARYAGLGVQGWHPSCQENLQKALAAVGITDADIPSPINIFQNTPAQADGTIGFELPVTKAGDYVELRAEMDCWVVLTACSQDLMPVPHPTKPMAIDLVD
jgi:uncharacterized protein